MVRSADEKARRKAAKREGIRARCLAPYKYREETARAEREAYESHQRISRWTEVARLYREALDSGDDEVQPYLEALEQRADECWQCMSRAEQAVARAKLKTMMRAEVEHE